MRKVDAGAQARRAQQERFTVSIPRPLCPCGTSVHLGYTICTLRGCHRPYTPHLLALAAVYEYAVALVERRELPGSGNRAYALPHLGGVPKEQYETLMQRMGVERYGAHWRFKTDPSGTLIPGEHCPPSDLTYAYPKHAHP